MRAKGEPAPKLRAAFAAVFAVALLAVDGCAGAFVSSKIAQVPTAASPELQDIARLARQGDKHAQMELGMAFEEGLRLRRDLGRAAALYKAAASDSGSTDVYVPTVGEKGAGRILRVRTGQPERGLSEAKSRLRSLRARRRKGRS